jgi:peptide/nickel transport system substrate-binding protein
VVPILAATVPTLANGGVSADGRTITYHLRHGVRWQDGVPFTSRDVAFTVRAIMNPNNDVGTRNGYERIVAMETPDDWTIRFHLRTRWAPFVNTVFAESDQPFCVLPEHLLARYPNLNRVPFNDKPIGTGPFRVVEWVHGDHIAYVANDDYFRGKPHLRRIVAREIPDENTEINALRTHDLDWMFEASPGTYAQLRALERAGTIRDVLVDMPQTYRVSLNLTNPLLRDVRVRRAIAYAIDKARLVRDITGGNALVGTSDQPPFSAYYEPDVTIYRHDPARARALLRAAGAVAPSFQISYDVENATRRAIAVQMQAMLQAAGITTTIKSYPLNLYFATYGQGGILTTAKYDIAVSGWIAGIDPDDYSQYGCDQFPPHGANTTRYCSPEMQALQVPALGSNDPAVRKRAYSGIQKLLARDLPEIVLMYPKMQQPISPAFKHFTPNPVNEAWNAYEWEI